MIHLEPYALVGAHDQRYELKNVRELVLDNEECDNSYPANLFATLPLLTPALTDLKLDQVAFEPLAELFSAVPKTVKTLICETNRQRVVELAEQHLNRLCQATTLEKTQLDIYALDDCTDHDELEAYYHARRAIRRAFAEHGIAVKFDEQ